MLRDYADLPFVLRRETDPTDPGGSFVNCYTFVSAKPWIEIPGEAPRQLLLIRVKPLADGSRGAIWRYENGDYIGGDLSDTELKVGLKGFDLANLQPMGGALPPATRPFPEPKITEYEAEVLRLVIEKETVPQENPGGKMHRSATPSGGPKDRVIPATPQKPRVWPWVVGAAALIALIAFVLHRYVLPRRRDRNSRSQ